MTTTDSNFSSANNGSDQSQFEGTTTMPTALTIDRNTSLRKPGFDNEEHRRWKARVRSEYIKTERDGVLRVSVERLIANAEECFDGGDWPRDRILFVLGDSGTGKSLSLKRLFAEIPEFQPRENPQGQMLSPLLSLEAPPDCDIKSFMVALLEAIGIPILGRPNAKELLNLLRRMLPFHGYLYLHVDEMQHVVRTATPTQVRKVQDTLKALSEIPGWPLHAIYSGTPLLGRLLDGDRQVPNRSLTVRYPALNGKALPLVKRILQEIVVDHCGMEMDWTDEQKVQQRLVQASSGGLGTMIVMIRAVCFDVARAGRVNVTLKDFEHYYHAKTGCLKRDNIFAAGKWSELSPVNALDDLIERTDLKGK
jgi:hypothetical protein